MILQRLKRWTQPVLVVLLLKSAQVCKADLQHPHRRKPRASSQLITTQDPSKRIHVANMTCHFMPQPLNHFALPRNTSSIYMQRYCIYDEFVTNWESAPILFYTGNEAPLEEYINNTGLMWEIAPKLGAQVVFAEHRYEGLSLPDPKTPHCMAYSSSIQALADFASLLEKRFFLHNHTIIQRPVIAFGGSYGGMLAAWMRIKYPNIILGAIAGSAPVAGFPYNGDAGIDSATRVIAHGLKQPYPPTDTSNLTENHCFDNLLASWSLISILERSVSGRELLRKCFRLCNPLKEGDSILDWAQSPWFDLAEGSFPYPSSYIIFALTKSTVKLPSWPLQAACWTYSSLYRDFGISFEGNVDDVRYSILLDGEPLISIDWDKANLLTPKLNATKIAPLLMNVRKAIAIWFNVTNDVDCFHPEAAPNKWSSRIEIADDDSVSQCRQKMAEGSWPSLCCNEEMNLVITAASGLGGDFLWPPTHPRGTKTYMDIADQSGWTCDDPNGYFGYPQNDMDVWSTPYESYYGNTCLNAISSNIVYSNGLLDPWSAAGVYSPRNSKQIMKGLKVQTINNSSTIAVVMDYGGHHTDLMYSDKADPPSIRMARDIEEKMIRSWIGSFWKERSSHSCSFYAAQ